ncbi:MAG: T9SS type B sorting domain-containing protein [Lutibacter sp.]|nr:T9SS type B sorting domain-containing protein [Lutibacter sp.]
MHFKKHIILFFFLSALFVSNYSWAQTPPELTASGNQFYCPLSQLPIVTGFTISNPDNVQIKAIYIQISTGYVRGEDQLILLGTHPNITVQPFNNLEGKMELRWTGAGNAVISELISAVNNVFFRSSSNTPSGSRTFSITIGEANYLPSTGHYYEYVPVIGITWQNAKTAAEGRTYYGLQGYLATITSADEAKLSGEQAAGAGWIGGSDAAVEGTWRWVTGPEAGKSFFFGDPNGIYDGGTTNGADIPFSFWNNNEPNQAGNEDYAHVTAPGVGIPGSWNDLSNTGEVSGNFQPKGYIVEYGGMPGDPVLNLSASTTIYMAVISATTPAKRCGAGTVPMSATATSGAGVLWFDTPTSTTILHSGSVYSPTISATTTYYVLASANGCVTGPRTAVTATVNPLPVIQSTIDFKNCDEDGTADGFTDFNLNEITPIITNNVSGLTVSYHLSAADANTSLSTNPINPSPFNNQTANTVYARVQNSFGCFSVSTIKLSVSSTLLPASFNYELAACDKDAIADGYVVFDLTEASTILISELPSGQMLSIHYYRNLNDAQLEQNEISPTNYINQTKDSQVLYVRVENENDGNCYGIGPFLTLTVQQIPQFEVNPTAIVCLNLPPITLQTFNPQGNYTYEWTDASGTIISEISSAEVAEAGVYTVIATSVLNCESFPKTVTVTASDIATITMNDITVVDDSDNNSITLNNTNLGAGDYAFALDAPFGPFQDETYFENLLPGIYTLYVSDKNSCGVAALDIAILGFPKFFTPNGDGYNDTWKVLGTDLNNIQISGIYVFDRFGKLVADVDLTGEGWDGFYNGERLPAADYWYLVKFTDQYGNYREKRGNLSLIRR